MRNLIARLLHGTALQQREALRRAHALRRAVNAAHKAAQTRAQPFAYSSPRAEARDAARAWLAQH